MMVIPDDFSVEERSERAMSYFHKGFNCSQSVAMAFSDIAGIDTRTMAVLAAGFGGGFGRMREVCGAVSGMTMIAGVLSPAADEDDVRTAKKKNYELVQEFAASFREMNGSIVCRELLGLRSSGEVTSLPEERTKEYYKKRPCEQLVGMAAGIVAKKILSMK